jgi:hypothetical protein
MIHGLLNPVYPTSRNMPCANIDMLSKTRYHIHFDVHLGGACLSEEILEKYPLFDMLLISYCGKY